MASRLAQGEEKESLSQIFLQLPKSLEELTESSPQIALRRERCLKRPLGTGVGSSVELLRTAPSPQTLLLPARGCRAKDSPPFPAGQDGGRLVPYPPPW